MRKAIFYFCLAAMITLCGCAKTPKAGLNDANKRYFDAWIKVHHPDAKPTALGVYVLETQEGTGQQAGNSDTNPYVRLDLVQRNLDGAISYTNIEEVAKRLGTYKEGNYYGPEVWTRLAGVLPAGIEEVLSTMRVGGSAKFVMPGWLMTVDRYDTAEEYIAKVSGSDHSIYEFTLREVIPDIKKWETDSIGRYLATNKIPKSVGDSLKYGYYYIRTGEPSSTNEIPNDTTLYINYTGRLLNGTVFDTTVKDTAKFYGIYDASKTYQPVSVTWFSFDEDYTKIQLGGSEVVDGFAYTLYQMHAHEKGTGIFYSGLGYKNSGSGDVIPGYAPLRFDIELVDAP